MADRKFKRGRATVTFRTGALEKNLGKLGKFTTTPETRAAFLRGAEGIRDRAAAGAPRDSGRLADSQRADVLPGREVGAFAASEAPHSHLVNFGTAERFHASGKSVGSMPADPFMTRAEKRGRRPARRFVVKALQAQLRRLRP